MTHTPKRELLYDELARRINALVGSAPKGASGALMHLPTLTGQFESADGMMGRVCGISKVGGSVSLFDIKLDLGQDLNDATVAQARSAMQQRLHGTVEDVAANDPYLNLRYDSRPNEVYMQWATPACNYIEAALQLKPMGEFDQEYDHPFTAIVATERVQTSILVTRRMGESGFTVRITPGKKQCLPGGGTWTEDGAIAAIKYSLPGYQVTTVTDYTNQKIIATITT